MFSKHEYSRYGSAPPLRRGGHGHHANSYKAATGEGRPRFTPQPSTVVVPLMDIQTGHRPAYGWNMRRASGLGDNGSSATPGISPLCHSLPPPENIGQDFSHTMDTATTVVSTPHLAGSRPATHPATTGVESFSLPSTPLHSIGPFASTAWPLTMDTRTLLTCAVATACRWSTIFPLQQAYHMLCAAFPAIDPPILDAVIRGIYTARKPFSLQAQGYGTAGMQSAPPLHVGVPPSLTDVEMVDLVLDLHDHTVSPPDATLIRGVGTPVKDENIPDFTNTM